VKPEEVERLYDREYVASYDDKFLTSELSAADAEVETRLLRSYLRPGDRWLDAGCGTGWYLSRFPDVERVGIDLSPAMLERARAVNPGVELRRHDFREPIPEWRDAFALVSCMWYAYTYVDTLDEVCRVIDNLTAWTSPSGRCFVPLADPEGIARTKLPYRVDNVHPGQVTVTGILWSYAEEGSKVHRNLVTPHIDFMVGEFSRRFRKVRVIRYHGGDSRPALVAHGKRGPERARRWRRG
jgi:SAM-dependent methyltransferase